MMKLEELQEQWQKDTDFDRSELGAVAMAVPKLHHKYYKLYSTERLILRKMEEDLKILKRDKMEFYMDGPTEEQIALGWKLPSKGRILKSDIGFYIDSDKEIVNMNLKICYQTEKVNFLESIIKTIANMGFYVKSAIDWEKFKVGI